MRSLFDNSHKHQACHHSDEGAKIHENGVSLYKSPENGDSLLRARMTDYVFLGMVGAYLLGAHSAILAPIIVTMLSYPRKVSVLKYFTFRAELLPHTEQVVFIKGDFMGGVRRIYVDISNLEHIDASSVSAPFLFATNFFDRNMVFRDMESREIFVFAANGVWNEDALNHKLLN